MPKLTKTLIDASEPRASAYFVWCSDLPGFGIRVFPSGKKTFYVDYYNLDGQRKRMAVGPFGTLTTDEARKLARITLGSVLGGEDPATERKTRRKSITVAELCDQYLKDAERGLILGKKGRPKKASTLSTDKGRITRHIKPLMGRKLVIDLKQSDINRFIRDVMAGKTAVDEKSGNKRGRAIVEGGAGTAARTTGLLGGILTYAVSEGIIASNPVHGVKRPAGKRRMRRLDADEYHALGKVLRSSECETELRQSLNAIWLLLYTGCRSSEITALKWEDIDIEGECLRLGDSKTDESIRPLAKKAIDVLKGIERESGNPYVLVSDRKEEGHYAALPGAVKRIMKRAKLEDVTPHTLRHSFASVGDDLGLTEITIGACIGHSTSSTTGRYVHKLDAVLIAAVNKIADEIADQMA